MGSAHFTVTDHCVPTNRDKLLMRKPADCRANGKHTSIVNLFQTLTHTVKRFNGSTNHNKIPPETLYHTKGHTFTHVNQSVRVAISPCNGA